ncbi:hypothetical protein fHeYen902_291 [Yersinia phage fHe-Yen9-02]|nr:hypothetical protein fHeYen902_291 [Yersinia phage fHe-Yen9-02]
MLIFGPSTKLINRRDGIPYDISIGRDGRWGNKYHMKDKSLAERNRVCDLHKEDLWRAIRDGSITLSDLDSLYGKTLGCWCVPKRCHGLAVMEAVEWAHNLLSKYERIRKKYKKRRKKIRVA